VAKIVPDIASRDSDAAKRSAVYRMVRGLKHRETGERLAKQPLSKAGQTAVNRRAGRLLARKPERDAQGRQIVSKLGIPVGTPISPHNHGKLAIAKINRTRRLERERIKRDMDNGILSQALGERQLKENARLTPSERRMFLQVDEKGRPVKMDAFDWDLFKIGYKEM